MNLLAPRPWDSIAYAVICIVSLAMAVFFVFYLSSHCEWVYAETGVQGACGLGYGWEIFALGFLAIAAYAGWQFYLLLEERHGL